MPNPTPLIKMVGAKHRKMPKIVLFVRGSLDAWACVWTSGALQSIDCFEDGIVKISEQSGTVESAHEVKVEGPSVTRRS